MNCHLESHHYSCLAFRVCVRFTFLVEFPTANAAELLEKFDWNGHNSVCVFIFVYIFSLVRMCR